MTSGLGEKFMNMSKEFWRKRQCQTRVSLRLRYGITQLTAGESISIVSLVVLDIIIFSLYIRICRTWKQEQVICACWIEDHS